jgi:hypothetical protein
VAAVRSLTIEIPVEAQDLTKPLRDTNGRGSGFQTKVIGHALFKVADPLYVDDPQRVLWKPDGQVRETQSSR